MSSFTVVRTPIQFIVDPQDMVRTMGRIHLVRRHGRLTFADLWSNGARIQIIYRGRECPWVTGMWVDIQGNASHTQSGELSIWVEHQHVVGQSERALETQPSSGRIPPEQQFVMDPSLVQQGYFRSRVLRHVREFLWRHHFEEVSTPILSAAASGATARPFQTHARALDQNMFLRVAPESHLIRLMMAGFDRIFEIGPCFRNEGISDRHQPQFELMECYRLGDTIDDTMTLVQDLLQHVSSSLNISCLTWRDAQFDFNSMARMALPDLVQIHTGCTTAQECQQWLEARNIVMNDHASPMRAWADVFELGVEHHLQQPTFVTQWPSCVSPLARSDDGLWSERFELYVAGVELANGYEQERNTQVQRLRFEQQVPNQEGDIMAQDNEYLFAMGWGMPTLSGFGIGVDRFVQMLANMQHIRQTILFPM